MLVGRTWSNLSALTDVRDVSPGCRELSSVFGLSAADMTYPRCHVQPDCKGGVTRWESGRALVLSHSDSCTGRVNETVRLSTDNGVT